MRLNNEDWPNEPKGVAVGSSREVSWTLKAEQDAERRARMESALKVYEVEVSMRYIFNGQEMDMPPTYVGQFAVDAEDEEDARVKVMEQIKKLLILEVSEVE